MLRRAIAINSVAMAVNVVGQLVSVAVLSRLLSPAEIGTFSVAASIAAMLVAFRDIGVSLFIVQERDLTDDKLQSAITLLVITCSMFGLLLYLSSDALAVFYRSAGLTSIVQLIAANFVFVPWIATISSRMQRELAYGELAAVSIVAGLMGITTSIVLAWQEMGPISLAWGTLASTAAQLVCLVACRPRYLRWTPTVRAMPLILRFGWKALVGSIASQTSSAAPDLILGRTLGFDAVALFNRAMAIRSLVASHLVQVVQSSLLPKLAAEHRDDELTAATFLYRNRYLTGIFIPIYALTIALAEPLTLLLFGSQWLRSVPIAQLLCAAPILAMPYALVKTVSTASGRMGALAGLELACLAARVFAIAVGSTVGLAAAAALMAIESLVYAAMLGRVARQTFGLGARKLYRNSAGDFGIGLAGAASAWLGSLLPAVALPPSAASPFLAVLFGSVAGFAAMGLLLPQWNPVLHAELRGLSMRILVARGGARGKAE
jgi:O-antigen/teichoic acid export membrane protein